jgi:hypothetical protein
VADRHLINVRRTMADTLVFIIEHTLDLLVSTISETILANCTLCGKQSRLVAQIIKVATLVWTIQWKVFLPPFVRLQFGLISQYMLSRSSAPGSLPATMDSSHQRTDSLLQTGTSSKR